MASALAGETRTAPGLPNSSLTTEGPLTGKLSAPSSGSVSGQGSLGHGFPLIPAKMVNKIQRWELVNISALLPDNLELARRSAESRGTTLYATLKSPKKQELSED